MTSDIRNGSQVKAVQDLVVQLKSKQKRIEELEEEVKALKAQKKELEEVAIPDTMSEIGVQSLTLMTSEIVTVKPFYYARLPQEPEPFLNWLRDHGFGGLVKEKLEAYPNSDLVQYLVNLLDGLKVDYECNSTVHWKTLEAWFKECTEAGIVLPTSLFPNYVGRIAKVKG